MQLFMKLKRVKISFVYFYFIGTERTLILDSRGWRYSSGGWEKVFKPLSTTCTDKSGAASRPWGSMLRSFLVVI